MTDIFLSYASADRAAANAVQAALTARGHDVFWDQEVPAGQDWDDWIRTKLSQAPVCIVLWSKTSIASPNVRHEAMIARDAKKLVPAMIEALAPADFPMGLYLVQSVQLGDWRNVGGAGMTRLVAEVEARLGRGGSAVADAPVKQSGRRSVLIGAIGIALSLAGVGYLQWRDHTLMAAAAQRAEAAAAARTEQARLEAETAALAAENKQSEWLGVPEFEGTWVRGERGTTSCDGFPWRFEPAGAAMRWLTADAPMTVLVQKTDPPTLNLNGETLVYEADGQIHYYAPSGTLYCTARRA